MATTEAQKAATLPGDLNVFSHNPELPISTRKDFDDFRKLFDETEGWIESYTDEHTKVHFKNPSNTAEIQIKLVSDAMKDIPAQVIYEAILDPDYRKTWDDRMIEGFLIEQIDAANDIGYYSVGMPFVISNRDWVNRRSWWHNPEMTEFVIFNFSNKHPLVPEKSGFVRAWSYKSGYYMKTTDKGTMFYYFGWNSWNGWIPAWCVNKATKTMVGGVIDNIAKTSSVYENWKKDHNPSDRPWLRLNEWQTKEKEEYEASKK
uniref:START domain-containing protein 10 n=1 Tax=Entamoeba invadens TaxID=33085 RepID=S0B346_ENTIV|nr:phosphatidylcholine transfer protein, putative [Entamoeba invadens]